MQVSESVETCIEDTIHVFVRVRRGILRPSRPAHPGLPDFLLQSAYAFFSLLLCDVDIWPSKIAKESRRRFKNYSRSRGSSELWEEFSGFCSSSFQSGSTEDDEEAEV